MKIILRVENQYEQFNLCLSFFSVTAKRIVVTEMLTW